MVSFIAATPGFVYAQSTDVEPPVIEFEIVEEGVSGETQVFSATVADNNEISIVSLHYRFGSDGSYNTVPMSAIQGTDFYTASVDTSQTDAAIIQYYLEAKDAGGNRTVQGFAFDPYERLLVDDSSVLADSTIAAPPAPVVVPRLSTQRKIAYGLLGVIAVGALIGATQSSPSGGSSDPGQVDVSIVVDRFQ